MKNFGGQLPVRQAAYEEAFQDIRDDLGDDSRILAAGFTEIANNQSAAQAFRGEDGLCAQLGVHYHSTIRCGGTVLGGTEYLALGFDGGVTVKSLARVFIESSPRSVSAFLDEAPDPNNSFWAARLPKQATADYRGIVVAKIKYGSTTSVVGFLHNVYSFEPQRMSFAAQIPRIMGKLKSWAGAKTKIYLGGDYNLNAPPGGRRGNTRTSFAYAQARGLEEFRDGTTWGGHLYDFWFTSHERELDRPLPLANGRTLDGAANSGQPLSDHAAILLLID